MLENVSDGVFDSYLASDVISLPTTETSGDDVLLTFFAVNSTTDVDSDTLTSAFLEEVALVEGLNLVLQLCKSCKTFCRKIFCMRPTIFIYLL